MTPNQIRVGFTGTQLGMTGFQRAALMDLLVELQPDEFHHGDCIGADHEAHHIVRVHCPGTEIHLHPPTNDSKRAFCVADVEHEPWPYLIRNHNIVDKTQILIAAPKTAEEELRSGTWATIRYARRSLHRVIRLLPDGTQGR